MIKMNRYLLSFRFSHPTVREVSLDLESAFGDVVIFDNGSGEANFMITTSKTLKEIQDYVDENLPYSIRLHHIQEGRQSQYTTFKKVANRGRTMNQTQDRQTKEDK